MSRPPPLEVADEIARLKAQIAQEVEELRSQIAESCARSEQLDSCLGAEPPPDIFDAELAELEARIAVFKARSEQLKTGIATAIQNLQTRLEAEAASLKAEAASIELKLANLPPLPEPDVLGRELAI